MDSKVRILVDTMISGGVGIAAGELASRLPNQHPFTFAMVALWAGLGTSAVLRVARLDKDARHRDRRTDDEE